MTEPRVFPAPQGWWCVEYPKVAFLPAHAVQGGRLTETTRQVLTQRGFFARRRPPFGLTVLTATSCNLGCPYCFQNTESADEAVNSFAPARIKRHLLTQEDTERIAAFAQQRMQYLGRDRISLVIFGGEPLLNPRGCVNLLKVLGPLNLEDATMISNCVLLTPRIAQELSAAGLQRIQVSFDGGEEEHNNTRYDHRGSGTYEKIFSNIDRAMRETGLEWQFRANISHRNIDGIEQLIDDLASLPASGSFRPALVDDYGIGYANELDYEDLAERFIKLIDRALDAGLHVPILGVPVSRCVHCSGFAGASGSVINADGTLYSCWETAGKPGWEVGDVTEGYLPEADIRDRWVACDSAPKPHGTHENARIFYEKVDSHILTRTRLSSQKPHRRGVVESRKATSL
ncbi:radical SAM protein [Streptomyces xiamenensis]